MSTKVPIAPRPASVVESTQNPSSSDPEKIAAQAMVGNNDAEQNDTQVEASIDVEASTSAVTHGAADARETHASHPEGANEGQVPAASPLQPSSSARSEKAEPPEAATASMSIPPIDADKDKTSESTTLSGTQTHAPQSGSSKRKPKESDSEGVLTPSLTPGESPSKRNSGKQKVLSKTKRPSKPSILSKFFRILVPCIGPSRSHPIDVDEADDASAISEPSITLGEKQASKDAEPNEDRPKTPPASDAHTTAVTTPATLVIPPPSIHTDVILPPTPTKQLLPLAETEGLTSGAVQPPGSTGEPVGHDHSRTHTLRDSGDESEGTSFTEEEDETHAMDEVEDEEDRLIMNGGAGIPIGPVSAFGSCRWLLLIIYPCRMASQDLYYPQLHRITLAENAWFSILTRRWFTAASKYVLCYPGLPSGIKF
jgi:carboxy-terminal domain RNA polymerase II polypeptide A small phosphatase